MILELGETNFQSNAGKRVIEEVLGVRTETKVLWLECCMEE
jgi:hypothetical protein